MILPTIQLPINGGIFDINFYSIVRDYELQEFEKIKINKIPVGRMGMRYEVSFDQEHLPQKDYGGIVFGELEYIPIDNNRIEVICALIEMQKVHEGIEFIGDFYDQALQRWQCKILYNFPEQRVINEYPELKDSPLQVKFLDLDKGIDKEYFYLKQKDDDPVELAKTLGYHRFPSIPTDNPELEEKLRERLLFLEQGLPKINDIEDTPIVVASKKGPTLNTQIRAELFKKIKEKHPEWTQYRVALEASKESEEVFSVDNVRNAYTAMGWKWPRADRVR